MRCEREYRRASTSRTGGWRPPGWLPFRVRDAAAATTIAAGHGVESHLSHWSQLSQSSHPIPANPGQILEVGAGPATARGLLAPTRRPVRTPRIPPPPVPLPQRRRGNVGGADPARILKRRRAEGGRRLRRRVPILPLLPPGEERGGVRARLIISLNRRARTPFAWLRASRRAARSRRPGCCAARSPLLGTPRLLPGA